MTVLRSPSGSWVNVRDGHKVRVYLRWGWIVFTKAEVEALFFIMAAGFEEKEALDVIGESGPEMFTPDRSGSIVPIGALE